MLIDYFTEFLKDGDWHNIDTIVQELDRPDEVVREIVRFCADFDFILIDESGDKIKLREDCKRILD
jgi:hypothetical protein